MTIKGFIFDLDGTLADTLPHCLKSFQLAYEQVTGVKCSESQVTDHFGLTEEGIIKRLIPDKWEEGLEVFLDIYEKNHSPYTKVFDGIIEVLDYLKNNGYKIAMVTGKGKGSADITLKYLGIANYFEFVELGSEDGLVKAERIRKILSKWGLNSENVAYIGDAITDITESRDAKVLPVAVTWATTTDHNLLASHNPYMIFSRIDDFKNWLELL